MKEIIKHNESKSGENTNMEDEFHLLFMVSHWEDMVLFPYQGNYRFLNMARYMMIEAENLVHSKDSSKPINVLHCIGLDGKEILIPSTELKLYATQCTIHDWGFRYTEFFMHTNTGIIYFLEDNFIGGVTPENEVHEPVIDNPLFAIPLNGRESEVIDPSRIRYVKERWFKLQDLNTDKDW